MDSRGNPKTIPGSDTAARYQLPEGATVLVADGSQVEHGQILARIPQAVSKTRDITGGLPRVAELFEARTAKDRAILATHTGVISFGKEIKTKIRLLITDEEGVEHEMDHIICLRADVEPVPNPNEIAKTRWVTQAELRELLASEHIGPWFRLIAENLLPAWWENLDDLAEMADTKIHVMGEVAWS